jgi:hypothetical protein
VVQIRLGAPSVYYYPLVEFFRDTIGSPRIFSVPEKNSGDYASIKLVDAKHPLEESKGLSHIHQFNEISLSKCGRGQKS